jgi:hypothetical protein
MAMRQRINDEERRLWVLNDETLYLWWRSSRATMRQFIRENREELTSYINKVLDRKPS